jgi:hypothetical protein
MALNTPNSTLFVENKANFTGVSRDCLYCKARAPGARVIIGPQSSGLMSSPN